MQTQKTKYILLNNQEIPLKDLKSGLLLKEEGDKFDAYRKEYNDNIEIMLQRLRFVKK